MQYRVTFLYISWLCVASTFAFQNHFDLSRHRHSSTSPIFHITDASSHVKVSSETELRNFLSMESRVPMNTLKLKHSHVSVDTLVTHYYYKQLFCGLEIINADGHVNVNKHNNIISYSHSFNSIPPPEKGQSADKAMSKFTVQHELKMRPELLSPCLMKPMVSPQQALVSLLNELQVATSEKHLQERKQREVFHDDQRYIATFAVSGLSFPVPVHLAYKLEDRKTHQVYDFEVRLKDAWYNAHVSTQSGQILSIVNWVHSVHHRHQPFRVYPLGVNDPTDGEREYISFVNVSTLSPEGWFTKHTTKGNNAITIHEDDNKLIHHPHDRHSSFDYGIDFTLEPDQYMNASIVQLFYTINMLHDLFYVYGFTETAGNFQQNNFGRGGLGNDRIIAYAQDIDGYNNANMAVPPDGRSGEMRVYQWRMSTPHRDGVLDNGIVIHEFSHGVTSRLTGGPHNVGCLSFGEAGGMGEGWGDVWATILRMRNATSTRRNYSAWQMGLYANGGLEGVRKCPYISERAECQTTYESLNDRKYWGVHAKGEVWATMLLEVFWNIMDILPFTKDLLSASRHHGNTLFLHMTITALKLQPCRPNFLHGRDAILQAERLLTDGRYACAIWKGFAKRGLGIDAHRVEATVPWEDDIRYNGYNIPDFCES